MKELSITMTEEGWYTICGNKVDKLRQVQFVYKYNNYCMI